MMVMMNLNIRERIDDDLRDQVPFGKLLTSSTKKKTHTHRDTPKNPVSKELQAGMRTNLDRNFSSPVTAQKSSNASITFSSKNTSSK